LKLFQPLELAVISTSERILALVKEESTFLQDEAVTNIDDDPSFREDLKNILRNSINEIIEEADTAAFHISCQARDYIHSNEIIMTIGKCKVVAQFLKEAARVRKFQVMVAETAPL
jgi:translation initiation factor 2B subunit (eIF-2B alpha/beta/delta family)